MTRLTFSLCGKDSHFKMKYTAFESNEARAILSQVHLPGAPSKEAKDEALREQQAASDTNNNINNNNNNNFHEEEDPNEVDTVVMSDVMAALQRQAERLKLEAQARATQAVLPRTESEDNHDEENEENIEAGHHTSSSEEDSDDNDDFSPYSKKALSQRGNDSMADKDEDLEKLKVPFLANGLVYFHNDENNWFAIHKEILKNKGAIDFDHLSEECESIEQEIASLSEQTNYAILMLRGGHFAGAIINKGKVISHKCFHRYVVRAKRGTAQSTQDDKRAPKSAGANLRRYNENMLQQDIRSLLQQWGTELDHCDRIFLQCPLAHRGTFFSDNLQHQFQQQMKNFNLTKSDPRLRHIPFETQRPTLKEAIAVYCRLAAIYHINQLPLSLRNPSYISESALVNVRFANEVDHSKHNHGKHDHSDEDNSNDNDNNWDKKNKKSATKAERPKNQNGAESPSGDKRKVIINKDADAYVDSELYKACLKDDHVSVIALLKELTEEDINYDWNHNAETALHAAARQGSADIVMDLLKAGCDPSTLNASNQPPYTVTKSKEVRDNFRRFMAEFPDKYNYSAAKIPSPLTAEMEKQQEEKKAERARKEKARQKARQKAKKAAEEQEKKEQEKKEQELKAKSKPKTKAEQQAEAREQRAAAALARLQKTSGASPSAKPKDGVCANCEAVLIPKKFLERYEYKYCSIDCLQEHKTVIGK